jgi:hypothetical protein
MTRFYASRRIWPKLVSPGKRSDTEELLAALRATHEPLLDGLASYLLLPLLGWSVSGEARDHWVRARVGRWRGAWWKS